MIRMAYVLSTCMLLAAGGTVRADSEKAKAILTKAQKVSQSLKSLSFDASFLGDGPLSKSLPVMDATIILQQGNTPKAPKIRIDGAKTMPRGLEPMPFRFASNGVNASYADDTRRIYMMGKDDDANPQERIRLLPPFFMTPDSFDKELKAHKLEYGDTMEVAGVPCHIIDVTYDAAETKKARICVGEKDLIVRSVITPQLTIASRRTRQLNVPSEIFVVRNVAIDPEIGGDSFSIAKPGGYRVQPFVKMTPRAPGASGLLTNGSAAPDWTLKDLDGKDVSLKSLRGQVVVIDFWASWCGPCKMAMPHLQKLHDKYKEKPVKVYSVNCRERGGDARAKSYLKEKKFTYPQLFNGDTAANAYRVRGIPTMYVIGTDGKILHSERGFKADLVPTMSRVIDAHLKKATAKAKADIGSEKSAKAG